MATTVSIIITPVLSRDGFYYTQKAVRLQGGTANESTIKVFHAGELTDVILGNASAVQDAHCVRLLPVGLSHQLSNERVHLLGLLRRRILPSANGPDRFIRDHDILEALDG